MNIPEHTKYALDLWVNDHLPTGGFLEAVINNNLEVAVARADDENRVALADIVVYISSISGVPKFYAGAMLEWVKQK